MEKLPIITISRFIPMILVFITLFLFYGTSDATVCSKKSQHLPAQKPKVILVHGFTCGGWCWYKVRWRLELLGYTVMTPDLKASGMDLTNVSTIESFEQYNEPLERLVASFPKNEKVVLVAHSAGGVSLTKIIHDHPEKILVSIFVCATMLKNGYLTCEDLQTGVPHFGETKCNASCPTLPKPTCFHKIVTPSAGQIPAINATEDTTLGKSLARPGPYRAVVTANFPGGPPAIDKVPRVYVKTLADQTLIPEQQEAMIKRWPPCEVHAVMSDHDAPSSRHKFIVSLIVNATSFASGDI